jgi:immune inhibitor A
MERRLTKSKMETTAVAVWSDFCAVAPSPELRAQMLTQLERSRQTGPTSAFLGPAREPRWPGFNDGTIFPPEDFPPGTSAQTIRAAAAARAPLQGTVRVIVILVDYSDKVMAQSTAHFENLFFSTGVLPHGSVKEYYAEATGGVVNIVGEVKGPYRLPQTLAWYANGNFGIGKPTGTPRAHIMAQDAATAANAAVNFAPYDNDGNGFVDAFVVIHAGSGGEQSGNSGDIWSHKWTLPSVMNADGTKIYAYLTVPEDCRIGVCAHELGHLLFGFPDLYDTDNTSEGVGNWCLMGGGSWNGGGDVPAHPSAWCKVNQGWATVTNVTSNGTINIPDVKTSRNVHRVWQNGASGPEYFLLENRQRTLYDAQLPAGGLLIWHIDENQPGNTDENHYKVGLVQADGLRNLELSQNRGDGGDPYPGSKNNTSLTPSSSPNSNTYAGASSGVSIGSISASGATMTANISVSAKSALKDTKDSKDAVKDTKEVFKERKDNKERKDRKDAVKEFKEPFKERKDGKDRKDIAKEFKEPFKERKDLKDFREGTFPGLSGSGMMADPGSDYGASDPALDPIAALEARVSALEEALGLTGGLGESMTEPFIGADLRPDLAGGPVYGAAGGPKPRRDPASNRDAKIELDTVPVQARPSR